MEESDGQDSSVVRRPIVIVSMNDTIEAATVRRPLKRQGFERKSGVAGNLHLSTIASSKANKGLEGGWLPSGRRSSVAEHWRLKPEALGSIPGSTTFSFKPLPFQWSTDGGGPDCLTSGRRPEGDDSP